jgi:hypothetical protein
MPSFYKAHLQHALHYAEALDTASRLFHQGGNSMVEGLRLYDAERQSIQAAHAWAARYAESDVKAASLCSYFAYRGAPLSHLREPAVERVRWLAVAVSAAQRMGDRHAEAVHYGNLGLAYRLLNQDDLAVENDERALAVPS